MMFRFHKIRFILLVFTIILMFSVSMSSGICKEVKYKFNLVTADPTWGGIGIGLLLFSSSVRSLTAGGIDIQIYTGGEWGGNPEDNLKSVELGELDMAGVNVTPMAQFAGGESLEIFNLPFAFKSPIDQFLFTFESEQKYTPTTQQIVDKVNANANYVLLTLAPLGRRDIFANKPVSSVEDLKGLKVRTMGSSMQIDAFNFMGAIGTPMPFGECYTALQLRSIDAMENSPDIYLRMKYNEVAPYWLGTKHYTCTNAIVMSKKAWDSLPVAYQNVLKDCGITTGYVLSQWAIGNYQTIIQGELEPNVKSARELSEEEHNALRTDVLPKLLDKYGKDTIGMDIIKQLSERDEIVKDWYEKNK